MTYTQFKSCKKQWQRLGRRVCVCPKWTVSLLCFSVFSYVCVRLFCPGFVWYTLNDFLLELVVRLQSQTIFLPTPLHPPSLPPSLSPSVCCCSALCIPAAIQFRRIPSGIQLKFLPNNQLTEQRQTAWLLSSSVSCQGLDITHGSK